MSQEQTLTKNKTKNNTYSGVDYYLQLVATQIYSKHITKSQESTLPRQQPCIGPILVSHYWHWYYNGDWANVGFLLVTLALIL